MIKLKSVTTIGGHTFKLLDPLVGSMRVSQIVLNEDEAGNPSRVSIWKSEGGVCEGVANYPHASIPYHAIDLILFDN